MIETYELNAGLHFRIFFFFFHFRIKELRIKRLRTFTLIVSAQVFCASHVSVARTSSRGPREEKCHAKVCKQIWRPRRKVKQEVEVGDS